MFASKATAALIRLKEIDRKYRIKREDEKQHRSLSISELSSIEQEHAEILSQSQGIPASGDRPDSSARIKLNIQMPDTRMEPNDATRSSLSYQPDAHRHEVVAILKKTEHSDQISQSATVEEDSDIPEDQTVGPAGEGAASDTMELIISREDSENHTIDRDPSIIESVAESLRQVSSHFDEVSQQQGSARSRSSIPTEVVVPQTAPPSDTEGSYSEDFVNSGSSSAAESLDKSTSSKTSPKNGSNQETGVDSNEESVMRTQSPDPLSSPQRNSMQSKEVEKKVAPKRPSPRMEAAFENVSSSKWTSKSSDSSTKFYCSNRKSGTNSSRDERSRVKDSLSEDGRNTIAAPVSDSEKKSDCESSRGVSAGQIAVAQPGERVTKIQRAKTCNMQKAEVTSKCEHPEGLASYCQDEIVRLVLGRLKAEVPAAHASRRTPSKRLTKLVKKRTRQNACLVGPLQPSGNNNCQIPTSIAAPMIRTEGDPSTHEKPKSRAKDAKSGCPSPQKRRSPKAKNEKTNRIQRQKSAPKRGKESLRLRNENQDLRTFVRQHVRKLIEEQQRLSVWPEIPINFAPRDAASRERRCFKPLDLPNVVAFEKSELEDEVVEPNSRSLTAIRQRVLEIRHRLKDQFALYRDYSDLVSIVNAKYKPVTLKETKKIIREMRRRRVAPRDDHVHYQ